MKTPSFILVACRFAVKLCIAAQIALSLTAALTVGAQVQPWVPQRGPVDSGLHERTINAFKIKIENLEKEVNRLAEEASETRRAISAAGIAGGTNIREIENKLRDEIKEVSKEVETARERPNDSRPPSSDSIHLEKRVSEIDAKIREFKTQLGVLGMATPNSGDLAGPTPGKSGHEVQGSTSTPNLEELAQDIKAQKFAVNIMWTLSAGFLVMLMQAGFALVETGFVGKKNAAHTMSMVLMVYCIAMLGYWLSGFALQCGGVGDKVHSVADFPSLGPELMKNLNYEVAFTWGDKHFGIFGLRGFFLPESMTDGGIFTFFLFQMLFMAATAAIPTGSMAERWRFKSVCWYALAVGGLIYPVYANWVWGGGWLAAMGKNWGLGHGHVDFAGSSVVHLCGGTIALVGAWVLGPRVTAVNPHNVPFGVLGTFLLAFGWFGFNAGSTLSGSDTQIGVIATNTIIASGAGAFSAMFMVWRRFKKPDPTYMCNGMLAGLVAITGSSAYVYSWTAVLIGLIAGIVMFHSALFFHKRGVDDPVGAISVHGTCGLWGIIALGLFANGKYGEGLNEVNGPVKGAFYGDPGQLFAQGIGAAVCIVAVGALAYGAFALIDKYCPLKSKDTEQEEGLDQSELGVTAYSD